MLASDGGNSRRARLPTSFRPAAPRTSEILLVVGAASDDSSRQLKCIATLRPIFLRSRSA